MLNLPSYLIAFIKIALKTSSKSVASKLFYFTNMFDEFIIYTHHCSVHGFTTLAKYNSVSVISVKTIPKFKPRSLRLATV